MLCHIIAQGGHSCRTCLHRSDRQPERTHARARAARTGRQEPGLALTDSTQWGPIMATEVLAAIPAAIILGIGQRWICSGLRAGALQ